MFTKFVYAISFILTLSAGASIASAATYTYTFTGGLFEDSVSNDNPLVPGSYDSSMRVSGYFILSKALPSNLDVDAISGSNVLHTPTDFGLLDFSFTDGRQTIDMTTTLVGQTLKLGTDSAGNITDHAIVLTYKAFPFAGSNAIQANSRSTTYKSGATFWACPPGVGCRGDTANSTAGGNWLESSPPSSVPVPATFPLLLAALSGFAVAARRRKKA